MFCKAELKKHVFPRFRNPLVGSSLRGSQGSCGVSMAGGDVTLAPEWAVRDPVEDFILATLSTLRKEALRFARRSCCCAIAAKRSWLRDVCPCLARAARLACAFDFLPTADIESIAFGHHKAERTGPSAEFAALQIFI